MAADPDSDAVLAEGLPELGADQRRRGGRGPARGDGRRSVQARPGREPERGCGRRRRRGRLDLSGRRRQRRGHRQRGDALSGLRNPAHDLVDPRDLAGDYHWQS
ncbi:MAG TPA: hypothetical protein VF056_15175 [Thermoleophilaceae bacterium]